MISHPSSFSHISNARMPLVFPEERIISWTRSGKNRINTRGQLNCCTRVVWFSKVDGLISNMCSYRAWNLHDCDVWSVAGVWRVVGLLGCVSLNEFLEGRALAPYKHDFPLMWIVSLSSYNTEFCYSQSAFHELQLKQTTQFPHRNQSTKMPFTARYVFPAASEEAAYLSAWTASHSPPDRSTELLIQFCFFSTL